MGKLFLGDLAEHAAEDRDPDPAGDEHVAPVRLLGQEEVSFRLLDLNLGPDRQLSERALEGAVPECECTTRARRAHSAR